MKTDIQLAAKTWANGLGDGSRERLRDYVDITYNRELSDSDLDNLVDWMTDYHEKLRG